MAPPAAEALHALGDLLALRGSQHLGDVGERLREALRRLFGELDLLCTQRLDRTAVDALGGEELDRLLARGVRLLAHRQQVLHRLFHDRLEPLLLFVRRVDLHVQVLESPLEVLVERRWIDRPGGETAAVPAAAAALSEGLEADSRGDSADERGDRRALEEPAALVRTPVLRFHDSSLS